jgi:hypothetical protein
MEMGVIGRLPGRRCAITTAVNHDTTLIDSDEVVRIVGPSMRGITGTEGICGTSRTCAVSGEFLIRDFEGRRFEARGEREHVLEFPLLEKGTTQLA